MIGKRHLFTTMKGIKQVPIISATLICSLAFNLAAADLSVSEHKFSSQSVLIPSENIVKGQPVTSGGKDTYIVRLKDPAIASYQGDIEGYDATNAKASGNFFIDGNAKATKKYHKYLKSKQKKFLENSKQAIGRELKVKYTYQHAYNGVAMELSEVEAKQLAHQPDVISVVKERVEYPTTDAGPAWIGAPTLWNSNDPNRKQKGLKGYQHKPDFRFGSKGEGSVIAILDSGINHDHPSFADIGGDGYDHTNPLGSGNYIPDSYCDVVNPDFCNDKLIGAWDMVQSPFDPNAPEDSDGHGSHTASTAAGNVLTDATIYAPTTELESEISGVAPHANIIAYDVCIDSCPGSALLAAINQVVIDSSYLPNGIQALNYSISGGGDPYSDPIELGFLNASAAGIYVAASAGNSGPAANTVAHLGPWVSTTGAMTHNRAIVNVLSGLIADNGSLDAITGAGFTSAYGPAPIVYAGDYPTTNGSANDVEPEQCLEPFPAGTFSGEIVVCDRGSIARVAKGANVLAGGAGGFILANDPGNGESVVGDAHFLPGIHIGHTDGSALKDWIANAENPMAQIDGFSVNLDPSNGDIMAGFSSRGPNTKISVLKPDISGPGVGIKAAINTSNEAEPAEFGFLSGTSMSSPHNAGSGALVNSLTDWTPFEIKSALMMTSKSQDTFKEDGVTPADWFDLGAGRIDLEKVLNAGLVLDETPENFLNADPSIGGDPSTLNLASMQSNLCVGECTWTRVVTNATDKHQVWHLNGQSDSMDISVYPKKLALNPGEDATITITANTLQSPEGWNFGQINLIPARNHLSDLHMPIAANVARSTSINLAKTVSSENTLQGDVVTYEISVTNGQLADPIDIFDQLPEGVVPVPDSLSTSILNGVELSAAMMAEDSVTWQVQLDTGNMSLVPSPAPFGFYPLSWLGVAPLSLPGNCDDGGSIFQGLPSFDFAGNSYSSVIMSVNGGIEVGTASSQALPASPQLLPDPAVPNNIVAPYWTDLNLCDGGNWYVAVLNAGPAQFIVFEWENVPFYNNPNTASFQIWILVGSEQMWIAYGDVASSPYPVSVGVENDNGTLGGSYEGEPGLEALALSRSIGGTATLTFDATIESCDKKEPFKVNNVTLTSADVIEKAYATSGCSDTEPKQK
ncbi:S8 family serine peptidase [Thalassotalea aquiviva]|uniref:S8 family serine peptidase n=1 Tax=Thalassotalea aquiviva TaxID=3242415 RepID=UPI00352B51DF